MSQSALNLRGGIMLRKEKPDDSRESSGVEFGACGPLAARKTVATTAPADVGRRRARLDLPPMVKVHGAFDSRSAERAQGEIELSLRRKRLYRGQGCCNLQVGSYASADWRNRAYRGTAFACRAQGRVGRACRRGQDHEAAGGVDRSARADGPRA